VSKKVGVTVVVNPCPVLVRHRQSAVNRCNLPSVKERVPIHSGVSLRGNPMSDWGTGYHIILRLSKPPSWSNLLRN